MKNHLSSLQLKFLSAVGNLASKPGTSVKFFQQQERAWILTSSSVLESIRLSQTLLSISLSWQPPFVRTNLFSLENASTNRASSRFSKCPVRESPSSVVELRLSFKNPLIWSWVKELDDMSITLREETNLESLETSTSARLIRDKLMHLRLLSCVFLSTMLAT